MFITTPLLLLNCLVSVSGQEMNRYRSWCSLLFGYDWVGIPLVYTQVWGPCARYALRLPTPALAVGSPRWALTWVSFHSRLSLWLSTPSSWRASSDASFWIPQKATRGMSWIFTFQSLLSYNSSSMQDGSR